VIRPVSVAMALFGSRISMPQRRLIGWFGIRGIGSIYYLAYAVNHGLNADLAQTLSALTLLVIAVSVVVHGISVTPLMKRYQAQQPVAQKPQARVI
jgi:sodium/hydrogen antiporter